MQFTDGHLQQLNTIQQSLIHILLWDKFTYSYKLNRQSSLKLETFFKQIWDRWWDWQGRGEGRWFTSSQEPDCSFYQKMCWETIWNRLLLLFMLWIKLRPKQKRKFNGYFLRLSAYDDHRATKKMMMKLKFFFPR